ncbi:MAG: GlxA family transcriptional regulator [Pseudomonadota bacterium]
MTGRPPFEESDFVARAPEPGPRHFGFFLFDQFPLLPVSGMIDVLRDTAYVTGTETYRWCTIACDEGEIRAMNGLRTLADHTIETAPSLDAVIVCMGLNGHLVDDRRAIAYLRRLHADSVRIGAIATGTWLLAKAGILAGRRCTLHWEDVQAFSETYPRLDVTRDLYRFDGPIFTCSGGTGAIDMFLDLVAADLGPEVSSAVARQIMHQSVRSGADRQPGADSPYRLIRHRSVRRALTLMENAIENPITIAAIAEQSNISQKQLERLFLHYFQTTPQLYFRALRLDHARTLVRLTNREIWEIALIVGFSTANYFSKCYRHRFGLSPSEERQKLPKFDYSSAVNSVRHT